MKLKDALAADYWIENTDRIYEEDLHVSGPVMDAYRAGYEEARREAYKLSRNLADHSYELHEYIQVMGEEEECEK